MISYGAFKYLLYSTVVISDSRSNQHTNRLAREKLKKKASGWSWMRYRVVKTILLYAELSHYLHKFIETDISRYSRYTY